jgi:long-chain acyl-CoA synthetase
LDRVPDWPNTATMMLSLARHWARRPFLRHFRDGAWHATSWGEFGARVGALARGLRAAGIVAGDRVVIVAENRPEFPISEVALQALRAVPVPTYVTNTVADHAHILRDSGATAAIVSTASLAAKLRAAGPLDLLICMEPAPGTLLWSDLAADDQGFVDIAAEAALIPKGALAAILYTSGTGGAPRGVMLPHRALIANCRSAFELVRPLQLKDEVYLSFLPLSHAYEHTVGQFFLPLTGTEIVYARGVEHLAADMLTIRPTIMTMVPRILEVIRARILGQVAREKPWRQRLFHAAIAIGRKLVEGQGLALWERLADPLLDRLVRRTLRARFGGRFRAAMSGGARLEPEVGRFFQAIGIQLMQGYGQTEAGPVISAVSPLSNRVDTVGQPLENVEVRIAEDGEILVRGDLVMDGYWGRPEDTARALQNGWLHTGDIGTRDADGFLHITDRKKDLIVLSGGENVAPARIEGLLIAEPAIAQAVVAGDGQAFLSALLVPAEGFDDAAVAQAVSAVNQRLSVTERVRRHALVPPFTLENGLLTATQKIRRALVIQAHSAVLDELMGGGRAG